MTWRDKLATILLTLLIALAILLTILSFAHGLTSLLSRPNASRSSFSSDIETAKHSISLTTIARPNSVQP